MVASDEQRTEKLAAGAEADPHAAAPLRELAPGARLGRYRIERLVGRGGMGAVYLATQVEPVKRQVAIKVCLERRLAADDLSRFLVERQVLARMSHPAIAQLLDGGTLEDGSPYFVMEYVDGSGVLHFARQRGLDLEQRLRLFREFCHGVEHAHRRGVIHCDLKPSNLLVVEVEGRLQPKVIDFGIARALVHDGAAGSSAGTPGYMSPEQSAGVADLDTRTDIYSLGVLLYELVAERSFVAPPGAVADSLKARLEAMAEASQRVPLERLSLQSGSRFRLAELEAVVARATAAEREARYGSAQQIAEELGRWLQREAVGAYSSGWIYRLACTVRRHALLTTVSALALLAVALLGMQLGEQYREIRRQRDVAEQTAGLLLETFQAADPYTFPGASMSVRELLARSARRTLERGLDAAVKLRLLQSLAEVQANLELWDDALRTRGEALRLAEDAGLGAEPRARIELLRIRSLVDLERWDEALAALDGFASDFEHGAAHPLRLEAEILRTEIWEYTDRRQQAQEHLDAQRDAVTRAASPELEYQWQRAQGRLAVARQDGAAAIDPLRRAYQLAITLWGEGDPRSAITLSDLALAEALAGDMPQAERHRRSLVALSEMLFGGDSVGLAIDLSNLGVLLQRRGGSARLQESVRVYQRALAIFEQRLGDRSADTATAANGLASGLEGLGEHDQASAIYQRAEAMMRAARGEMHSLVGIVQHNWGRNELAAGRLAEAARLLESSGAILLQGLGESHPRYAIWRHTLARLRLAQGRSDEVRELLQPAIAVLQEAYGPDSEELRSARDSLAEAEGTEGRP
jgi:non-specific serine/threonine protein kinase/serine/threonine-protein kinase